MKTLEVFDRPLCCSTGVCGPAVDPALVHFAADLDWLRENGVDVRRFNLAFEPAAFTKYDDVKEALRVDQIDCLPIVRFNGRIVSKRGYPSRELLAGWTGTELSDSAVVSEPCCESSCCQ